MGKTQLFNYKDVNEFEKLQGVKSVTPVYTAKATVKYELETSSVSITGGNENFVDINNYQIDSGRSINPVDIDYRNMIALIGLKTAENLFGQDNPINNDIYINGEKYTVVGVLKDKGSTITGDSNDIVIVSITTINEAIQYKITKQHKCIGKFS